MAQDKGAAGGWYAWFWARLGRENHKRGSAWNPSRPGSWVLRSCASEDSDSNLKRRAAPIGCGSELPVRCSGLGRRSVDEVSSRNRVTDGVGTRSQPASGRSGMQGASPPVPRLGTGAHSSGRPQVRHIARTKDGESGDGTAGLQPLDSNAARQERS